MSDLIHEAAVAASQEIRWPDAEEEIESILRARLGPALEVSAEAMADHEAMGIMRQRGIIPIQVAFDDGSLWWILHDKHNQPLWVDGKCCRRWRDPALALIAADAYLAAADGGEKGDDPMNRATKRAIQKKATEVVDNLFTSGSGYKADHLELRSNGRYLGGWSRKPMVDRVVEAMLWAAAEAEKETTQ